MRVKVFNDRGNLVGIDSRRVAKSDAEWLAQLGPQAYAITRRQGTEPPFCGGLLDNHRDGVYSCLCCGLPLFAASAKFESGSGWPSFFQPLAPENLTVRQDRSHGMLRQEVLCARCDAHLGHVFDDGPPPTRLRYCMNGAALAFTAAERLADLADPAARPAA